MKRVQLANYKAAHFGYAVDRQGRDHHAEPARAQESADARELRRAARPVPRNGLRDDVKAVVFTGEGGNFCSGGDVHDIIGKLVKMDMPGCCVHADDRRPGQGDARLPAADHRRGRRHLRRRRRDDRDGGRHALCDGAKQDRVPVRARRPGRRGHGRVHDAAAHDRAVARRRTALHRPRRSAARKPSASGFTIGSCAPDKLLEEAHAMAREPRRRSDVRSRHDQDDAAGVELGPRRGDRGRGAGAGDLHADQGFRARLSRVRRPSRSRCSKATEACPPWARLSSSLAVLRRRPSRLAREDERWAEGTLAPLLEGAEGERGCRLRVRRPAGTGTRRRGVAARLRSGGLWRRARRARRAQPLPGARDRWAGPPAWPISPSRCRDSGVRRSRCSAATTRSRRSCRAWPPERWWPPSRCRSRRPARTSVRSLRPQCAMAIAGA